MRLTFRSAALAIAVLVPALAWRAPSERLTLQAQSKLWIEGKSTIRAFSCSAATVTATIESKSSNAIPQLLAAEQSVASTEIKVPVAKIDCGNNTMNDHMREALKAEANPTITFRIVSYDVAKGTAGVSGTLKGTLSMGGVQKPVTITAAGLAEGEMLRVTGSKEITMSEWDVTPPSLMFGRIKVRDAVTVKFDLLLKN